MALSNDEDWDSDEECAPQAGGGDDNELEGAGTEFWEGAVGGALGISGSVEAAELEAVAEAFLRLDALNFFV